MGSSRAFLASLLAGVSLAGPMTALPAFAAPLKVACTGSSSMAGVGSSDGHHISDELATALGADFEVQNFAVAATTAIKSVPNAWASTPQMGEALAFNPDIVLFWFGGNDSWVDVWTEHSGEFKADYKSIVQEFQALPSQPQTFLIRLWVFQDGPAQLDVLDQEILPMIDEIGAETNSTVIDYRTFIEPHPEWFDDGMHANDTGTVFIGSFFAEQISEALNASPNGGSAGMGGMLSMGGAAGNGGTSSASGGNAGTSAGTAGTAAAGTSSIGLGGSGAGGSSAAAAPMAGSAGSNPPAMDTDGSGCGCRTTPRGGSGILLLSALALLARRRRHAD